MILINLLCFNEKIMSVKFYEIKIKTFSHYNIKCHYSRIKRRDFFYKKIIIKISYHII